MSETAKTAAGDASTGPLITRMICRPNHSHRGKTYTVGETVEASPQYIRLMEDQGVLVPEGQEEAFIGALGANNGDPVKALAAIAQDGE